MKIEILAIGRTAEAYLQEGMDNYLKRLQRYNKVAFTALPDVKNAASLSEEQLKEKEAELYLKQVTSQDTVILLDETGIPMSSRDFARFIERRQQSGKGRIIFIIGGAFGFSEQMYKRADDKLSLSPMTMSHQLVRLMFLEQLYRAHTILKGEPYHHD